MIPKKGVDNIMVGHTEDATIISFDLQSGRNINIGSLVHHCADNSGFSSKWLLIEQKEKEGKIDTILYQKGKRKIVIRATACWRLFWTKYLYEFR